ncbi:hypothetical protein IAD21_00850 [Abditibacteriota bacterium]|nr:hypothetical protein IAD21_00850 [Abditibacteriota bacterium]
MWIQWMHLLLYFLGGFAITFPLSAASYFFAKWFRRVRPEWAKPLDDTLALLAFPFFHIFLLLLAPLCLCAAHAMRAYEGNKHPVFFYFVRALSSTSMALFIIGNLWIGLNFIPLSSRFISKWFSSLPAPETYCLWIAAWLGLVATPSALAIFTWVWHSSQLRPGVDRHFFPQEEAHSGTT